MKKTKIILLTLVLLLLLPACKREKVVEPIQPLTKVTISPERDVLFTATQQAWINENPLPVNVNGTVIAVSSTDGIQKSAADPIVNESSETEVPQGFYQLQAGETPKCIARRFNVDWLKLYSMNNISFENENAIQPGTVLILPQNSVWNEKHGPIASAEHPVQYSVAAGDTLNSIACIFGDVFPEQLAIENGITSQDQLVPGLSLNIP
jgi:nucleoid-associated protein YgaU